MFALLVLLLFVSITNAFQSSSSFMGNSVLPAAQRTLEGRSTMTMEYIRKFVHLPEANWFAK
jgi:hypothetical protein